MYIFIDITIQAFIDQISQIGAKQAQPLAILMQAILILNSNSGEIVHQMLA